MSKYNSESWAIDANRPAIEGKYGDLHIFMDHIELCVEPTRVMKSLPDRCALTKADRAAIMAIKIESLARKYKK